MLSELRKPKEWKEKLSNLIRNLPEHFYLIAMRAHKMNLEELINTVETDISRRMFKNVQFYQITDDNH